VQGNQHDEHRSQARIDLGQFKEEWEYFAKEAGVFKDEVPAQVIHKEEESVTPEGAVGRKILFFKEIVERAWLSWGRSI
jgi:hypothetical protein